MEEMEFVALLYYRTDSEGVNGQNSFGSMFCCGTLRDLKDTMNAKDIERLRFDKVVLSEGSAIFEKVGLGIDGVKVYGERLGERTRSLVWYEFVRFVTGNRILVENMEGKLKFTRWVVDIKVGQDWKVTLELESERVIEKIGEITFDNVDEGELDLFNLSHQLFESHQSLNDKMNRVENQMIKLQEELLAMKNEKNWRETTLEERDRNTRKIVLGLLNEKKLKIRELEQRLEALDDSYREKNSDTNFINSCVKNAVTELYSPGKRRRVEKPTQSSKRPAKNLKKKLLAQQIKPEMKSENDDFDDFKFFGINSVGELPSITALEATNDTIMKDDAALQNSPSPIVKVEDDFMKDASVFHPSKNHNEQTSTKSSENSTEDEMAMALPINSSTIPIITEKPSNSNSGSETQDTTLTETDDD